jgi:hypothetical protein
MKARTRERRIMMQRDSRIGLNPLVNASSGANGASHKYNLVSCEFCLKSFQPYRRSQRFCGARCRLLFWAAGELIREREAGNAEGIRDIIEKLK